MPDTLFEKLEMPSAPARPFEDDGVVMTASATPLLPMQVWSECEDLVAAHLAQVCAWPEEARGQGWVPGDYSFYVLEFEPTPGVKLSVQFWSEPGDKLLMEAGRRDNQRGRLLFGIRLARRENRIANRINTSMGLISCSFFRLLAQLGQACAQRSSPRWSSTG